ncbi:hypothetical protein AB0D46_22910 [Streptomyces sp. NPDC048383]|uniref:hypothetical protein n=1 Tax=Streptomyces sp. NPDC048383 TaxID=3155386 RepID=UPI00343CDAB6
MQRTKPSRFRVLVPSALAVVILSGAVGPAVAADGEGSAALTKKVEAVQEQLDTLEGLESRVAAGPIDDLLAGIGTTLSDLLKSLQALLPGVTLPEIKLPTLPTLPEIPALPALPGLPTAPTVPAVPGVPPAQVPQLPVANPAVPPTGGLTPAIPEIPAIPDIPIH